MTRGSASGGSTSRGICIQEKSASGDLHLGGLYPWGSASSGVCLQGGWADLPPRWDTMGYSQQGGGTHPTGMHSCCP